MKRISLALLLVVMLFSTSVVSAEPETPAGAYWQEMKTIYEEWTALESDMDMTVTVTLPDEDPRVFTVQATSESDLASFVSWMELTIETDDPELDIPVVQLYTEGTDMVVNTELVLFLADLMGMEDVAIEEDFVKLETTETGIPMDGNFLLDILEMLEGMEIGFDIPMTLEDDTYHLHLDSDQLVDLVDAYMMFTLTNMEQMMELTGQTMPEELTEEEMAEALAMYQTMVAPMLEMAKEAIAGSYYTQTSVFGDDAFEETSELFLTTPFGQLLVEADTVSRQLEAVTFVMPESVEVYTEEDLTNLMMMGMAMPTETQDLAAIIDVDGDRYVRFDGMDVEEGTLEVRISAEGRSYMTMADAAAIFDLDVEATDEWMQIRELALYGYQVTWNDMQRFVEVYHHQPFAEVPLQD